MKTLMPHQVRALDYAKPLARIALFCEMRLGKTLVAIRWGKFNKLKKVLVLAPKAVFKPWRAELLEEGLTPLIPEGSLEERWKQINELKSKETKWVLLNYEAVSLYPDFLSFDWDGIICDESTYLRKPKPEITKYLTKHTDHVGYKAILSGLPAPESPKDYFSQFKFLYGNFMFEHTYWHWQNKYCIQVGYDWEVKSCYMDKIKEEVNSRAFVLTRKDAGMGSKKVYERRYVEMNSEQIKLQKLIERDYAYEEKNEEWTTKYAPVKYLALGRIAGGFSPVKRMISDAKLMEIKSLLKEELKDQKVVIWFRFNDELEYVHEYLRKDFKCGIFTADKKEGLNSDNTLSENIEVMCAQAKLGKMGLPWHGSSAMIFYSNWYDYEVRAQCEDRGIHPLKKEPYLIIDLISEGSIDEEAIEILVEKKTTAKFFMEKLEKAWEKKKCQK